MYFIYPFLKFAVDKLISCLIALALKRLCSIKPLQVRPLTFDNQLIKEEVGHYFLCKKHFLIFLKLTLKKAEKNEIQIKLCLVFRNCIF